MLITCTLRVCKVDGQTVCVLYRMLRNKQERVEGTHIYSHAAATTGASLGHAVISSHHVRGLSISPGTCHIPVLNDASKPAEYRGGGHMYLLVHL